jgi:hypothetical protein
MTAPVDICNMALAHIGERSDITSIDPPEASVEAQRCALFYPISRKISLARHTWSFARKRVTGADLSASNTIPTNWTYGYAVPSDFVKVIGVYDPGEWRDEKDADEIAHEIGTASTGPRIMYSNIENAQLRYTFDQTDTTLYPPLFILGLSHVIASFLAGPTIKGMEGMKVGEAHMKMGIAWLGEAASEDANQSESRKVREDGRHQTPWMAAR